MASPRADMTGKICLVTGATSGIGAETARELAALGATVVLVGRRPDRGAEVREMIRQTTGSQRVTFIPADLSALVKVRQVAGEFLLRFDRLDVLVNAVDAAFAQRKLSRDGIEMTFALNYLGAFLLTNLLLDVLKASAPARIVTLSSAAHAGQSLDFDDLECRSAYDAHKAYARSKMAALLFTRELARRLEGTRVTANAFDAGAAGARSAPRRWGLRLARPKPERTAETSIYLATSPELGAVSGRYFAGQKEAPPAPEACDEQAARRLWEVSAVMAGLEPPTA